MRFRSIKVQNFQGIESAQVDLGPNLNILYGPNDLGKSTIATAVRAALLIPASSTEARAFTPWHKDVSPTVVVVFSDEQNRVYRMTKRFGNAAEAELDYSKDGVTFVNDAKGRDADRKVRELLQWGIPSPGGRGAPRGLPDSFLSKVLLAPQTDVDAILEQSLEADQDQSGKVKLAAALTALAQDPLLKRVLDTAQTEVDRFFTATGRRRAGKDSPFAAAAEAIRARDEELAALKRQDEESRAAEGLVVQLRERRGRALELFKQRESELALAKQAAVQAAARAGAEERLAAAKASLAAIDAKTEKLQEATTRALTLEAESSKAAAAHQAAVKAEEDARQRARICEDNLRLITSEQGESERAVQVANLEKTDAELVAKLKLLETTEERAKRVAAAAAAAEVAKEKEAEALKTKNGAELALKDATGKASAATAAHAFAKGVAAFSAWKAAATASATLQGVRAEAEKLRGGAAKLEEDAREQTSRLPSELPTQEQLRRLKKLSQELDRAEAALGGGLSVILKPKKQVTIHAVLDGGPSKAVGGTQPVTLEADGTAAINIEDLLDIEVQAGAPDRRQLATRLRSQWTEEGARILARHRVADLTALEALVEEAGARHAAAQAHMAEAARARDQAQALDARAADLTALADQLGEREAQLAGLDRAALEGRYARLGPNPEPQAARAVKDAQDAVDRASSSLHAAEQAAQAALIRLEAAAADAQKTRASFDEAAAQIDGRPHQGVIAEVQRDREDIQNRRRQLQSAREKLLADANVKVNAAKDALGQAQAAFESAKQAVVAAERTFNDLRAAFHVAVGDREARRAEVDALDRGAATAALEQAAGALAAMGPAPARLDVGAAQKARDEAELALGEVTRELDNAEGGLQRVGGAVLREGMEAVLQARDAARDEERELDVDAKAWALLRDVLRDAENEEGAHLGKALAEPVSVRFKELTGGRYGAVKLDQTLKAEGIAGVGAPPGDVLEALSVGTKDQLATLLRVTIAEQLHAAIFLDDHLVHTDPQRLAWFKTTLRAAATATQVVVLTCRPQDYLAQEEVPADGASRSLAGGAVVAVDLGKIVRRVTA